MMNVLLGRERFQSSIEPSNMNSLESIEELMWICECFFSDFCRASMLAYIPQNLSTVTTPSRLEKLIIKNFKDFTVENFLTLGNKDVAKAIFKFERECMRYGKEISCDEINDLHSRLRAIAYDG